MSNYNHGASWLQGVGRSDNLPATDAAGISVLTVNSPPDARDDGLITDEDSILIGTVFGNNGFGRDRDADGDPISVVFVNGVAARVGQTVKLHSGASLTLQADGSFSYDVQDIAQFQNLGTGQSATDSFTDTIWDGTGPILEPGRFDLASLDGTNGFRLTGIRPGTAAARRWPRPAT